jgi:hypothetical protein
MISKISTREWEALSAYLDDQLPPKERTQLAVRLETSPELREALENLRQTRAALRSVPHLRAPRNFTLSAEMAGLRPGVHGGGRPLPEIYPVLRLASILATFFFLAIFVGSLIGRNTTHRTLSMAERQQQPVGPPLGLGSGGGGGEGAAPEPRIEAPMQANAPEGETTTQAKEAAKAYEASPAVDNRQALSVTPLASPTAEPSLTPEPPAAPGPSPNVEVAPQFGPIPAEEARATPSAGIGSVSILLGLQVLLAIVAIGAGVGALYLRRSARK